MGSGLIWAGLGKGIADAGSVYGSAMSKAAETEWADQRAMQRAEALERLKDRMSEERAMRDSDIYDKAIAQGKAMAEERQAAAMKRDVGSLSEAAQGVAGESPVMSEAQMQKHLESLNPSERKALEGTGLIGKRMSPLEEEMQGYSDVQSAARSLGASSGLMKELRQAKTDRLKEIEKQFAQEQSIAREERMAQSAQSTAAYQMRMADAADRRASAAETKAGASSNKPATTADIQRQINATKDDLAMALGSTKNEVNQALEMTRKRAAAGDARSKQKLAEAQPFIDELTTLNQRMRQFKRADTAGKTGDNKGGESSASSSSGIATPTTQAEFDKLPSGALYVNPRDGRTYRKK